MLVYAPLLYHWSFSESQNPMFRRIRSICTILWQTLSLVVLLSVAATIPILQFASFGYMLEASSRVANGLPIRRCFPGAQTAGRLFVVGLCVFASWLPVWYLADMAYSAELIEAGGTIATRLRLLARVVSLVWIAWVLWAVFRGGKVRHFLWPAPVLAVESLFHTRVWSQAEDRLWNFVISLQLPKLLWLGLMASIGALIWLVLPSSLIVIGLSSRGPGVAFLGLLGALLMWWVLLHLPFLQIQMARDGKFLSVLDIGAARRSFRRVPWSFCLASLGTFLLAVPLYLLRIEPIPNQLGWILSFFFVMFMFPAKLGVGWALQRSMRAEQLAPNKIMHWCWRYSAWVPQAAVVLTYLGILYIAKFALWEGAASIYLQHAFLPPVPFFVR